MTYTQGHIKRDPASGTVAIRTIWPEEGDMINQAWLSASAGRGCQFIRSSDVADWDDLFVPDPVSPPDPFAAQTPGN